MQKMYQKRNLKNILESVFKGDKLNKKFIEINENKINKTLKKFTYILINLSSHFYYLFIKYLSNTYVPKPVAPGGFIPLSDLLSIGPAISK